MQWGTMGLSSKQSSSEWRDTRVQVRNGGVGGLWQGLGRKTGKAQRGGGVTQRDAGWKWCRCPGPWAVWHVLLKTAGKLWYVGTNSEPETDAQCVGCASVWEKAMGWGAGGETARN